MSRMLRQRTPVCYHELEEPSFDEYIFCSDCADYVYEYCSIHGPLHVIPDDKVPSPTGFPPFVPRAALTIPHVFLHLAPSTIPGAEIGVFTTLTLPSGVRFGPYVGLKTETPTPGYSWQIFDRDHKPTHAVDARDANRSNWMRYVNCSRHFVEQNLVAFQYQGQLYYRTIKIIPSCTELLVFYGSEFALSLGVDLARYHSQDAYTKLVALQCDHEDSLKNKEETKNDRSSSINSDVTKDVAPKLEKLLNDEKPHETVNISEVKDKPLIKNENNKTESNTNVGGKAFNEKAELLAPITAQNLTKEVPKKINRTSKNSCLICNCKFATKSELINHDIKIHDSKLTYKECKVCEYKTINNSALKKHTKTHSGRRPYPYTVCDSILRNSSDLKAHLKQHNDNRPLKCSICDKSFKKNSYLKAHLKTHNREKLFKCTECDSKLTTSYNLKVHLRIHNGERPYQCPLCPSKFSVASSLKSHLRFHKGEKPFECTVCGLKCYNSSALKVHMRIHTQERPFKCTVCDSKFYRSSNLKTHFRIHSGEKPYECSVCHSKFTTGSTLKVHKLIHTQEKAFKCTVCDSKFYRSYNLKMHFRIHTGEKPFKCTVCDSKFTQRNGLKSHLRIHNGKN